MSIMRGDPSGRLIHIMDARESATVEALRLRGLSLKQTACVASRLFGRRVGKSTVQQHLATLAKRQERDA